MKNNLTYKALWLIFVLTSLIGKQLFAIDSVRVETRIDQAILQYGVTGQNVAVAILDRGIDWKSNDFRNDDGTTRIAYIYDLTNDTGANWPNNPYGIGTIYSRAQIDSALSNFRTLPFRDAVGHGTTTSGIILGNGRNSMNRKWRGVAPGATIICLKIVTEGAPAHGNEPAEAPFYDPNRIPTAIDFAVNKAAELGMPCVMLLNIGSLGGPSDGTSKLCHKIDNTVGAGKPGLVFVTGSSDDGGQPNHAAYTISQGQTDTLKIQNTGTGSLTLDLWYSGNGYNSQKVLLRFI
jgi:subtilisin family serine protease